MAPNEDKLKVLKSKRGSIKRQITCFETFLNSYQERADPLKLGLRLDKLKDSFKPLDDIQDEIEFLEPTEENLEIRGTIHNDYFDVIAIAEHFLIADRAAKQLANKISEAERAPTLTPATTVENVSQHSNGVSIQNSISTNGHVQRRMKLPEAALPTFSGNYEDWLSFKDSFTSMIHSQSDLSNVEKLQYLKSALKGEAARKIHVFSITEDNYTRAWELLQKSYDDKRILIARHLNLLLLSPVQERETAQGLIKLADETQQHVLSLSSLGVQVNEEILVQNIENKLHKSTAERWDETLQKDVFPKLSQMIDFLYRTSARIANRGNLKTAVEYSSERPTKPFFGAKGKRPNNVRNQTFVTTTCQSCPLCKDEQHPLYRCNKFRRLSVLQRIKVAKDANLCLTCLRDYHDPKDCKLGNCKVCNQRHNTFLHQSEDNSATTSRV